MFTHNEPWKTRLTSLEATWINTQTTFRIPVTSTHQFCCMTTFMDG